MRKSNPRMIANDRTRKMTTRLSIINRYPDVNNCALTTSQAPFLQDEMGNISSDGRSQAYVHAAPHTGPADRGPHMFGTGWLLRKPRSNRITGEQSQTPLAHASPHGYEAAVDAGAPTTTPLSRRQRVAQSNPVWGRPEVRVQGAIDRAVAA